MPHYRRNYVPGGTYFFTVVTFRRQPLFDSDPARSCLREAIERVRKDWPFSLDAIVLLPDHLHAIWTLPPGEANYSTRWSRIKSEFTRTFRKSGIPDLPLAHSRPARRERSIWQHRFWEHTCEDADDVKRCLDYLHYNPVKHGLVQRVRDYPWSSFGRYVELGEYDLDWGLATSQQWTPPKGWE